MQYPKMTKFYVAGKWEDKANVKLIMNKLTDVGYEITCDWTNHTGKDEIGKLQEYAIYDIEGVKAADVVVVVATTSYDYRGGAIGEMTAAIALNKPVYLIGHAFDDCIFTNHPLVNRISCIEDLIGEHDKK